MTVTNRFSILLAQKGIRQNERISIAEVARDTGVDQRTLGQWAKNTISRYDRHVINSLCAYFNCSVCDLLEYEAVEEPFPPGEQLAPPGKTGSGAQLEEEPAHDQASEEEKPTE